MMNRIQLILLSCLLLMKIMHNVAIQYVLVKQEAEMKVDLIIVTSHETI